MITICGVVFGYDTVDKSLVINQKEAEVVKLIYYLYANGKGLKAITNHLTYPHVVSRNGY